MCPSQTGGIARCCCCCLGQHPKPTNPPGKTPQKSWEKGVSLAPEGLRWGSAAVPRVPASVSSRVAHPCKANPCWSSRACPLLPGDGFWGPGGPGQGEPGQEGAPQDAAAPGRCGAGEETRRVCSAEGEGTEIKKSPAKIRKAGEHSALLWSCHTSLYFIAFVQHPIVPLPFVPYSQPWLFITQPALLFSFLLFEVPERKVLFSAV